MRLRDGYDLRTGSVVTSGSLLGGVEEEEGSCSELPRGVSVSIVGSTVTLTVLDLI